MPRRMCASATWRRAVDQVNAAKCDCVTSITGDLITHDPDAIDPIVNVLSRLRSDDRDFRKSRLQPQRRLAGGDYDAVG